MDCHFAVSPTTLGCSHCHVNLHFEFDGACRNEYLNTSKNFAKERGFGLHYDLVFLPNGSGGAGNGSQLLFGQRSNKANTTFAFGNSATTN